MALGVARIAGVVLAGGRSTRFGSEKAVALVDGAPMIARVAAVLERDCERVAVSAREDGGAAAWARATGHPVVSDPPGAPDGPLAGVLAGLELAAHCGCAWLATAPCDTPWLPDGMVRRLAAAVGEAPAAMAVTDEGSHPLCALWSVALRRRLADALADGAHPPVRDWLREVGAVEVRFTDAHGFRNLNEPPLEKARFRAAIAVGLGLLVWFLTEVVATLAFALAAPVLLPCGPEPLCGGDQGARFWIHQALIPLVALAAGLFAGARVGRRSSRRR